MVALVEFILVAYVFGSLLAPPLVEAWRASHPEPARVRARSRR